MAGVEMQKLRQFVSLSNSLVGFVDCVGSGQWPRERERLQVGEPPSAHPINAMNCSVLRTRGREGDGGNGREREDVLVLFVGQFAVIRRVASSFNIPTAKPHLSAWRSRVDRQLTP